MKRRDFVHQGLWVGAAGFGIPRILKAQQAPAAITRDTQRPQLPHGVASGDVTSDSGIVWARSDRPARLWVEWSTREDFSEVRRVPGPHLLEDSDYTGRIDLQDLPRGQHIHYRVLLQDLGNERVMSEPVPGRFRLAPGIPRDIRLVWSGDTAGQGWGINPEWGGMRLYEQMRRAAPDLFLHCGDTIYADGPIAPEVRLKDGSVWRNLVTPEVSKVAETLDEYRGRYRYNLMDEHVRRFASEVAQIWQWDDHEVTNNWSPSKDLSADARYSEKRVPLLTARGTRAFLEYAPLRRHGDVESERLYRHIPYGPLLDVFVIDMRSYRGPNTDNLQAAQGPDSVLLGKPQIAWLLDGLRRSRATWKIIASDMPLGLQVPDGQDAAGRARWEAVANGEDGPARGRELEIAHLLREMKRSRIRNVVWLTADVHYTAAHYYDPSQARSGDFDAFWEFVSGPLHAGSFGPNKPDSTFGLQVVYQKAPPEANAPPSAGFQFFGQVDIDARTRAMTVTLKDLEGASLYRKTLWALPW
ncbi:alkaline phosphatase D family protein [Aquabacterium sp. A7-Y]|uniref:alkaline phosphatase D family protein n=1 Tax=Aquabacterium sp. A7-Y TaxID=1349605 RepID=UPI00223DC8D3|nr:alkaline phosphatase D family protein [Aquabacterium sp. A7-Y]MCW7539398.1 alkaline phosphatase D family protein [Aquabacterium sp. A7-Y]